MYIRNKSGPKIDPWGTPASTDDQEDTWPFNELKSLLKSSISCLIPPHQVLYCETLMSSLNHWLRNITCYKMVNILADITRKYTSRIREQLPTPIHLHQHMKTTILLTSSCNHTHNITFLILLLKKKGRIGQKMATLSQWRFCRMTY